MRIIHRKHGWVSKPKNQEQKIEMEDGEVWKLENCIIIDDSKVEKE